MVYVSTIGISTFDISMANRVESDFAVGICPGICSARRDTMDKCHAPRARVARRPCRSRGRKRVRTAAPPLILRNKWRNAFNDALPDMTMKSAKFLRPAEEAVAGLGA